MGRIILSCRDHFGKEVLFCHMRSLLLVKKQHRRAEFSLRRCDRLNVMERFYGERSPIFIGAACCELRNLLYLDGVCFYYINLKLVPDLRRSGRIILSCSLEIGWGKKVLFTYGWRVSTRTRSVRNICWETVVQLFIQLYRFLSDGCLFFGDFVQKHFKVMSSGDSVILASYDANLQLRWYVL